MIENINVYISIYTVYTHINKSLKILYMDDILYPNKDLFTITVLFADIGTLTNRLCTCHTYIILYSKIFIMLIVMHVLYIIIIYFEYQHV